MGIQWKGGGGREPRKVRGIEPDRSQSIGRMHQAATLRWTLPAPFLLICLTCSTQRLPNSTHKCKKGSWSLFCNMFLTVLESEESIQLVNLKTFIKSDASDCME